PRGGERVAEGRVRGLYVAAERLPEALAIHDVAATFAAPPSRRKAWTRQEAIIELLRGRLSIVGPTTAFALAESLAIAENEAEAALLALESEGIVLRGTFEGPNEWCDRRLLARIHRYTLTRLRAEIEPVTASDFMRFLFDWQHVSNRMAGPDGLRKVVEQLDGCEIAANAWERVVLPARIEKYEPSLLDTLCLSGEVGWAQRGGVVLFRREHAGAWLGAPPAVTLSAAARSLRAHR